MFKLIAFIVIGILTSSGVASCMETPDDFTTTIRPLLEKYCANCHSPGDMEGLEFLVDMTEADIANNRRLFAGVFEQMKSKAMPPKDFDQPTEREQKLISDWIQSTFDLKPSDTDRISQYVVEVYEDKKGNMWFGTMHEGVARFDGESLTYFTKNDGLPSNAVSSFAEDSEGNLWMGTHDGVCKYDGKTFTKFGASDGLPAGASETPMAWSGVRTDRKGNIWVNKGIGVYRYDGKSFVEFEVPVAGNEVTSYAITAGSVSLDLEDREGNLWFGTDGAGVFKFDGNSFTRFTKDDGLNSNTINSILEDKHGNIWFACMQSYQPKMTGDGGLCRFDGKTFTKFPNTKGLSNNDIYTIYETRTGDIWIGATGVGAYRYDGETFTLFNKTDRPHWTRNFGVQSIFEDRKGTLWFGFSGGLFRFDGKSFLNVTKEGPWNDLFSTMAKSIAGDQVAQAEKDWLHPDARDAMSAFVNGQFDQAETILQKLKSQEPDELTIQEDTINRVGYELIWAGKLELAVAVLKINTELYPTEFNTFDSLAEAYWRKGDEKLAVKHYKTSLGINPDNGTATAAIRKIAARQNYEAILVAPKDWLEEVIIVPPDFAPTMSITGLEHLRLPPDFRKPESEWFISYLFAIELTESSHLSEKLIGEQMLTYFRGLASGASDPNGTKIDTNKFSIEPQTPESSLADGEFAYCLNWQEPFANATQLKQNLRVKLVAGKNKHGVLFVCGSPQSFDSPVWSKLIEIRNKFELSPAPK